jgi:type IV pilus assembly protein PilO
MPDLRRTRKKLKTALAVMAGIDLLAAVVYFSPLVGSAETRRQEMNNLQTELITKTREVAPLKDLPKKVTVAGHQISDFYKKRFPTQESKILTEFGKIASANGVKIDQGKNKLKDVEEGGLEPAEMEWNLEGNYASLAHFINALERDEMFFIINDIALGGQPQGPIKLDMKVDTYLKAGS